MEEKKVLFLEVLVGEALGGAASDFVRLDEEREVALTKVLQGLTPEKKGELRERLTHEVVDSTGTVKGQSHHEMGQEYEIDSEKANRDKLSIKREQSSVVTNAYTEIIKMMQALCEAQGSDGKPLYPPVLKDGKELPHPDLAQVIADELFTPLVREGVLPENLVEDTYSETQKLLNAVYPAYRGTLRETEEEEEEEITEAISNYYGAEGPKGRLKSLGVLFNREKERFLKDLGVSPAYLRRAQIGVEVGKLGGRFSSAVVTGQRYLSANALEEAEEQMGRRSRDKIDALAPGGEPLPGTPDEGGMQREPMQTVEEVKWGIKIATLSGSTAVGGGLGIVDLVLDAKKLHDARELELPDSLLVRLNQAEASLAVMETKIDGVWLGLDGDAPKALKGLFGNLLDRDTLLAEVLDAKPEGVDMVALIAQALQETCETGLDVALKRFPEAPGSQPPALLGLGETLKKSFANKAGGATLRKAISKGEDPKPWEPVEQAFQAALDEVFTTDARDRLTLRFADPNFEKVAAGAAAVPKPEAAEEDLLAAQSELEDFERRLTLIDEVGESNADRKNVELLIQELKKDQAALKVAADVAKIVRGAGVGGAKLGTFAGNLTNEVAAQVIGPIKAAQLLVQLAVNVIKAVGRIQLCYRFFQNLKGARLARSPLTSTIEGLFNNKQEQVTFHMIEDVLLGIQAAGAILSCVPEPITFAVGKSMTAFGGLLKQGNKVAGMIYSEVQLTRAWQTTKEALNNPKDRATGLKALRLNPTLAIHALAWAAKTNGDPIARMILDATGLDEESLESGASEEKVREYLTTVLYEDRSLLDPRELSVKWAPATYTLSSVDWFVLTQRASTKATPKLQLGPEKGVLEALKGLEAAQAGTGTSGQDPVDLTALGQAFDRASTALEAYIPKDSSGGDHDDMGAIVAELQKKLRLARLAANLDT